MVVWERRILCLLNKRVNCKQELFFFSLPGYLLHLVPVTRIEFRRRWIVEGQLRDRTRSILTFFNTMRTRVRSRYRSTSTGSTHVRLGGQDGRREPDSGLGYTQDYGSRWTHENCFNPDSVSQRTEQPAGHERGAGDRPAEDWIPEETDRHGDWKSDAQNGSWRETKLRQ